MVMMKESVILIGICLFDLLTTLFLLGNNHATEGNPLMAYYLKGGAGTFVAAKLILLFLPIFIAEWCRQFRPNFVQKMLRGAIIGYVGIYVLLFLGINYPALAGGKALGLSLIGIEQPANH